MLASSYDGLIIESFGVGGLPNYGNDSFLHALSDWMEAGQTGLYGNSGYT